MYMNTFNMPNEIHRDVIATFVISYQQSLVIQEKYERRVDEKHMFYNESIFGKPINIDEKVRFKNSTKLFLRKRLTLRRSIHPRPEESVKSLVRPSLGRICEIFYEKQIIYD